MVFCGKCGKDNPISAKFCENCGATLDEAPVKQQTTYASGNWLSHEHAGFSGIVGYYVGKAKFTSPKNNNVVFKGLAIAAFSHGLFNFVLFTQTILAFLFIPLLIVLVYFLTKRLSEMSSASPFKPSDHYNFKCPKCKKNVLSESKFCPECGFKFNR